MTWQDLKRLLLLAGVKDDDRIAYIDIGEVAIEAIDHSTAQDPDGLDIQFDEAKDGTRTVSIS